MKEYILYEHVSPSGKIYIGITCSTVNKRWGINGMNYLCKERNKYKHPLFASAILKYGWDSFLHNIIASGLGERTAKNMEKDLIAFNKARGISYNLADGGDGHLGYIMSEERKLLQSLERTGIKLEGEWRQHVIDALERNRGSIAEKHKKAIVQLDIDGNLISSFNSIKEAQETTKIDASFIVGCCKGKYRTAGGFIWLYLNDYNLSKETLVLYHQLMPSLGLYKRTQEHIKAFIERMLNYLVPYEQLIAANKKAQEVLSKPVALLNEYGDILAVFKSASAAADYLGKDNSSISKCCKTGKKAYNYYWKYITKEELSEYIEKENI